MLHPSHPGPRPSEIRTARYQSSVPRGHRDLSGDRIPGQGAISGPPRWNFNLIYAGGDILLGGTFTVPIGPKINVLLVEMALQSSVKTHRWFTLSCVCKPHTACVIEGPLCSTGAS